MHDKMIKIKTDGGEWDPVVPGDFKSFVEAIMVSGGFDSLSSPPVK